MSIKLRGIRSMTVLRFNSYHIIWGEHMWKDSETELDFLDYDYLIQTVQSIITDDTLLPASIGV